MGSSIPQIVLYVLSGGVFGAVIAWFVQGTISQRRLSRLISETQAELVDVTCQRDQFATAHSRSGSKIESLQASVADSRAELESALKKAKLLAKNVLTLRAERENTKVKISTAQDALISVKQKTVALQTAFDKAREFYKGELVKSFEKRKRLEDEVKEARSEQESFAKLVEASISEHGSADNMIAAAQIRLGQLEVLERNVNKLEAENAQLSDDAKRMKRAYEALERDVAELDELRIHNQQLVRCVESLENSRKQHESDAERYRGEADQSEQLSETLRLKLDDLEKNFADIDKQQHQALKEANKVAVFPTSRAKKSRTK